MKKEKKSIMLKVALLFLVGIVVVGCKDDEKPDIKGTFTYADTTKLTFGVAGDITPVATGLSTGAQSHTSTITPAATGVSIDAATGKISIDTTVAVGTYTINTTLNIEETKGSITNTLLLIVDNPLLAGSFSYDVGDDENPDITNDTEGNINFAATENSALIAQAGARTYTLGTGANAALTVVDSTGELVVANSAGLVDDDYYSFTISLEVVGFSGNIAVTDSIYKKKS